MKFLDKKSSGIELFKEPIPLLSLIPKNNENKYYYQNGLSKVIPRLTLKVHSDIEECFDLWNDLSPKRSLFDEWDFRMAWRDGYKSKLYFYTLYEGKNPIALLPLSYDNSDKKRFEWFGTNWMEDNSFLVRDEHYIDLLYAILPKPLHLNAIEKTGNWNHPLLDGDLKKEDPKNIKEVGGFDSMDELLTTYKKKDRYNLRSDYAYVNSLNPKIVVTKGKRLDLLEQMMKMNITQFSANPEDESDLVVPKRAETYRNIVRNAGLYDVKFVQIFIQNHLAGIDFIITYKDRYYTIKGGIDVNRFKGISNFLVYYEFEDALRSGFNLVDCLQIDYGWKHRYFDQKETFLLEK